ncbi:RagB/SusD family nutrient uptake outer membrane protein [Prevotella sp.]|uniref:RagB/SusD family nutrient uptake outer membrane protein n=1 Tax=Prevotella sp. TaxID=59823 RepID=UPI002ABD8D8D|nr:RagB/SusD family nutrient uptake outer membrane protein [Prevotella sp.]
MKSIKTTIILLAALLSLGSCDFLDKEPTSATSDTYLKTETEATSFLKGIYAIITQQSYYGGNYFYLVGGDDLEHYGGSGRAPLNGGLICNNATSSDSYVTSFWYTLYAGVNRANILLSQIEDIKDMKPANLKRYTAEARFLRAFYYFNLVECWGDVPFYTEPVLDVKNLQRAVTPRATIYDFICKEMEESAEDLPTASSLNYEPGRVSKSAAWGILARVYMFRAGEFHRMKVAENKEETKKYFTEAGKFAKMVMTQGHGLAPNYWDYFIDQCADRYNTTANESIWEAEFAGDGKGTLSTEGRVGNIIGIQAPDLSSKTDYVGSKDPGFGYAFFWSTPKLYELYTSNNDIKRMNWSIAPFRYTQSEKGGPVDGREFEKGKLAEVKKQYWDQSFQYGETDSKSKIGDREKTSATSMYDRNCGKWRREYEADKKNKNLTAINFPILRYSDVLLMIAECENETHSQPTTEAYNCINEVRKRAGISKLPQNLDTEDFRQAVKDERAMELCFEMTRRFDLIRWGEYVQNMNALVSRAQTGYNWNLGPDNVFTYFNITEAYNYFPIPALEMSVNKLITKNNPGW